jgi:hypothetical protein
MPFVRPLPGIRRSRSGRRCHPPTPVPPSWFRTTSTASSARRSRACCIPQPTLGFAAFHAIEPSDEPAEARSDHPGAPRDGVHTLRRVPLASSRTASLRPLPSCRHPEPPDEAPVRSRGPPRHRLRGRDRLQGLSPLTSPLRSRAVASIGSLASPMGLVPPRGPNHLPLRAGAPAGHAPRSVTRVHISDTASRVGGTASSHQRFAEAPLSSVRRASS